MRIAIVGSRGFKALKYVDDFVREHVKSDDLIVTGGALGVDLAAMKAAKSYGRSMLVHYPDWNTYGKKAGYLRNVKIIEDSDVVVAFWDGLSKGTAHSISEAEKANKMVRVFVEDDDGNVMQVE